MTTAFQIEVGHVITIVVVLLAYLTAILLAWGRLTAKVEIMQKSQEQTVNRSDLTAAVAEMKAEMYRALTKDRRSGSNNSEER